MRDVIDNIKGKENNVPDGFEPCGVLTIAVETFFLPFKIDKGGSNPGRRCLTTTSLCVAVFNKGRIAFIIVDLPTPSTPWIVTTIPEGFK